MEINKEKIIVFGTGVMADLIHYYFKHDSSFEVVAFAVNKDCLRDKKFHGLPVVAFEDVETVYPPQEYKMFIPLDYKRTNKFRAEKYDQAKKKGYKLVSYVSSKAITWPQLKLGENCFIGEGNVIQPFVELGDDVFLWTANHVGHHTQIKDHSFVLSNVMVSAGVTIEPYSFLGVNSTIGNNLTVAQESIIGAGTLILENTNPKGVYLGAKAQLDAPSSDHVTDSDILKR